MPRYSILSAGMVMDMRGSGYVVTSDLINPLTVNRILLYSNPWLARIVATFPLIYG